MKLSDLTPRTVSPLGPWPVRQISALRDETDEQKRERKRVADAQRYISRLKEERAKHNAARRQKRSEAKACP